MIDVRAASGPAELQAALALRERVFCDEQGVTLEADQDGLDPEALQLVAYDGAQLTWRLRASGAQHATAKTLPLGGAGG